MIRQSITDLGPEYEDRRRFQPRNGVILYGDWEIRGAVGEAFFHFNWEFRHCDFDGPEDNRFGCANSLNDCVELIQQIERGNIC